MNTERVTLDETIAAARALRNEDGENPEYDRALVELVHDMFGYTREAIADRILGDRPSLADPPHITDTDEPCAWCGARWIREYTKSLTRTSVPRVERIRLGSLAMDHLLDCAYIRWQDQQAARAD